MVTVPAFVWRGGRVRRALTVGFGVAVPLAALAWLDSGMWLSAVLVLIILAIFYGIWMTRRMARYWPGAEKLSGEERVTVVRAARHGGNGPFGHSAPDGPFGTMTSTPIRVPPPMRGPFDRNVRSDSSDCVRRPARRAARPGGPAPWPPASASTASAGSAASR